MCIADSSWVTGTISGDDGSFRLVYSPPSSGKENFILKASYIGYETQFMNLSGAKDSLILRLREESEQLADQVAFSVGLKSASGFHRNFLLSYGMTPAQYRQSKQNGSLEG